MDFIKLETTISSSTHFLRHLFLNRYAITSLFWNALAEGLRNLLTILLQNITAELLRNIFTGVLGNELTGFQCEVTAILLRLKPAALPGNILTVLLRNLLAIFLRNLLTALLRNLIA